MLLINKFNFKNMNFYKVVSKDERVILKIILQKYLYLNVLTKFTLCKESNIIKKL